MENELRAPRAAPSSGSRSAAGETVELGDVLVVHPVTRPDRPIGEAAGSRLATAGARPSGRRPSRRAAERRERFETSSGIEIRDLYTAADTAGLDEERDLGRPGEYPFTRGVQPTMYRSRFWTMRQYAGLRDGRGDQPALPLPPRAGPDRAVGRLRPADPDGLRLGRPRGAKARSGRVGVPISSLADMAVLLDGLPLGEVSTSMTINATAPILLALYVAAAEAPGRRRGRRSPARSRTTSSRSTSPAARTSSRRGRRCAS